MKLLSNKGFSLIEIIVVIAMFSVISTAGLMLFVAGQSAWTVVDTQSQLQQDFRQIIIRLPSELQQSGTDKDGNFQVNVQNNSGVNNTDILQFSIPICPCGVSVIDENGDVKSWGAPLLWGQSGCNSDYVVGSNNKVDICHLPPGNPENKHELSVSVNAVKAHLAHGDWLGGCDDCDPSAFSNKRIEYRLNANGELLRNVLDQSNAQINSVVFANHVTDFQAIVTGNSVVSISVQVSMNSAQNRPISKSATVDVLLRN